MEEKLLLKNKILALIMIVVFVASCTVLGFISMVDKDKTLSEVENRVLKTKPEFSSTLLFNGSYTSDFDAYYADTFPFRDGFITVNREVKKIFSQFAGKDDVIIITQPLDPNDYGGEAG